MKLKLLLPVIFFVSVMAFSSCEADNTDVNPFSSLPTIDFTEDVDAITIISDDSNDGFINHSESVSPVNEYIQDSESQDTSDIITIIDDITDNISSSSESVISDSDNVSSVFDTENDVWIPASGKKYHNTSDCSNMKSPQCVSLGRAKELGYEPCKRCYK